MAGRLDVQIPAPDGHGPGTPHAPDGDGPFTAEQAGLLEDALTGAGVKHTVEFYPARHGFAAPGNPTYDAGAEAWHWDALGRLYRDHLGT